MKLEKQHVNKILVITLSNIGDVLLTTPVIYALRKGFPKSFISVMMGPRAKEIFESDPFVNEVRIFDKKLGPLDKLKLALSIRREHFDLVVDLRNTLFGLFTNAKFKAPLFIKEPRLPKEAEIVHMIDKHLFKLKLLGIDTKDAQPYINLTPLAERYAEELLLKNGVKSKEGFVVISPGAKSHTKRWTIEGFATVCDWISIGLKREVILVGTEEDRVVINSILEKTQIKPFDFCLKTNLKQLASLINRSALLITNDSAPLHLAVCLGRPVAAIFGPTDPKKYGPRGLLDFVIKKDLPCRPCQKALCAKNHECMTGIEPAEVFKAVKDILF